MSTQATPQQIEAARRLHCDGHCQIDDDAQVAYISDRGAWVQAWVYVPSEAIRKEAKS